MTEHPFLEMYYMFTFLCCASFAGIILTGLISALYGKDSAVSKVAIIIMVLAFLVSMVVIITPYSALQILYKRFY